jgi:hypothetical protein
MTSSFGGNLESYQQGVSVKSDAVGQIFPLETMSASGGLGLIFESLNSELGGPRLGKEFIRKRHVNGRVFKPKAVNKNILPNKQKEV